MAYRLGDEVQHRVDGGQVETSEGMATRTES